MKKIVSTLLLMACMASTLSASPGDSIGSPIAFTLITEYTAPIRPGGRSPVYLPSVSIDGYTLYFWDSVDYIVSIKEEDDEGNEEVVYTTFIPSDETTVNLPAYLSGCYIIEVCRGSQTFVGEIEL